MKISHFFLTLTLLSFGTRAASPYENLQAWFKQGQKVTLKDFKGWYSGRCFETWAPEKGIGTLLGYYQKRNENAGGPAFPSPSNPVYFMENKHAWNNSPDYFDFYNLESSEAAYFFRGVADAARGGQLISVSTDAEGDLAYGGISSVHKDKMTAKVRWAQGYYIVESSFTKGGRDRYSHALDKRVPNVPAGPYRYCYYFKKLGN